MKTTLVLILTTMLVGCSETDQLDLHGKWVFAYWQELDSDRREYPPSIAPSVSIEFTAGGNLSGLGPCNIYSGDFAASTGNRLSIRSLLSTERACVEDTLNRWEQRYFQNLSQVYAYESGPGVLKLYTGKPVWAMVFRFSPRGD